MKKYLFGWGDTRGIRHIMMKHTPTVTLREQNWESYGYPPHEGSEELIELTKKLIKDLTGKEYKYVLITNGATNALHAYIYAARKETTEYLYTHNKYFSFYPDLAKITGLHHMPKEAIDFEMDDQLAIIASPSNPEGNLYFGGPTKGVCWDAAYFSPTYCGVRDSEGNLVCPKVFPNHDAMVGSFNKLTGINGLRVGWFATDDANLYYKAYDYVTSTLCGVSWPSQYAVVEILKLADWKSFFEESKALIDSNKEELSKLNYLFGNQKIPGHGMFALFEADEALNKLLEEASVEIMPGTVCGGPKNSVRFNLSNSNEYTAEMVKAVLKTDKK